MKVVVDYDLCEANALCMEACPEVFRVEEDEQVQDAERLCPRQAIRIEG
jgi:ferredoxin